MRWQRGLVLVAAVGSALLPGVAAAAPGAASVVHPTGDVATDVRNVQAALDRGGEVLLKASDAAGAPRAFEFGTRVGILRTDVHVLGEDGTRIRGGGGPSLGTFVQVLDADAAVRGIHFDAPVGAAVRVFSASGLEFSGNRVTDITPAAYSGTTKSQAVWASNSPGTITGSIVFAENVVEGSGAELGYGVALYGVDARLVIRDNVFRRISDTGILVGQSSRPATVEDNLVAPGADGAFGNGIYVDRVARAEISRNSVITTNPQADGIVVQGSLDSPTANSVIRGNRIEMRGSHFGAVTLRGAVSTTTVQQNEIAGSGAHAFLVAPFASPDEIASSNVFADNDLELFDSSSADVLLDAHTRRTKVVGICDVTDHGTDNQVVCPRE